MTADAKMTATTVKTTKIQGAAPTEFTAPSRSAGHRVTPRGAEAREKILTTALEILSQRGYPALSISTVCKAAGASGASLYHHFGDKAGLINAMVEYAVEEGARLFTAAAGAKDKPLDQIDAFIDTLRLVQEKTPYKTSAVMMALSQAASDSPEAATVIIRAQKYVRETVAAKFAEFFGVEDASLLAHIHLGLASYAAQLSQSGAPAEDVDAVFDNMRKLLLIAAAALRPDFLSDPDFAAAVAKASATNLTS